MGPPVTQRLPLILAVLGALALAGCGVKGPLEPPPGATVAPKADAPPKAGADASGSSSSSGTSSVTGRANDDVISQTTPKASWEKQNLNAGRTKRDPLQGVVRPDTPFILDGLL